MHGKSNLWEQQKIKEFTLLLLIILKVTFCFAEILHPEYSHPEDICVEKDSCRHNYFTACSCSDDCSNYGICCWDASETNIYPLKQFKCYTENISQAVFVKQSCNSSYNDDTDVIAFCENDQEDWSDLMANVLVSSNKTWITYKNWNCAICNNENVRDLWFWTVEASYSWESEKYRLIDDLKENFVYDAKFNQWGVYDHDKFIHCPLKFNQPSFLHGELKHCAENFTSSCPSSWKNETVRQKCDSSYYGERKLMFQEVYFKNIYCALCNGFKLDDLDCSRLHYTSVTLFQIIKTTPINYNLNPNERTENYQCCSQDFRYDPFLKMCRSVSYGLKYPQELDNNCEASGSCEPNIHYIICILFIVLFPMAMM